MVNWRLLMRYYVVVMMMISWCRKEDGIVVIDTTDIGNLIPGRTADGMMMVLSIVGEEMVLQCREECLPLIIPIVVGVTVLLLRCWNCSLLKEERYGIRVDDDDIVDTVLLLVMEGGGIDCHLLRCVQWCCCCCSAVFGTLRCSDSDWLFDYRAGIVLGIVKYYDAIWKAR